MSTACWMRIGTDAIAANLCHNIQTNLYMYNAYFVLNSDVKMQTIDSLSSKQTLRITFYGGASFIFTKSACRNNPLIVMLPQAMAMWTAAAALCFDLFPLSVPVYIRCQPRSRASMAVGQQLFARATPFPCRHGLARRGRVNSRAKMKQSAGRASPLYRCCCGASNGRRRSLAV